MMFNTLIYLALLFCVVLAQYAEHVQRKNHPRTPWRDQLEEKTDEIEESSREQVEDPVLDRVREAILDLSPAAQRVFLRLIFIQHNDRLTDDQRFTKLSNLEHAMTPEIRGEIADKLNQAAGSTAAIMRYVINQD